MIATWLRPPQFVYSVRESYNLGSRNFTPMGDLTSCIIG